MYDYHIAYIHGKDGLNYIGASTFTSTASEVNLGLLETAKEALENDCPGAGIIIFGIIPLGKHIFKPEADNDK